MYFLITIPVIVFIAWLIFRKKNISAVSGGQKLDKSSQLLLDQHVNYYHKLNRADRKKFESMIADFLQYVHIEGVAFLGWVTGGMLI
jgi:hypothetical protein